MTECLESIVSIGLCSNETNTSGYTLMSAPGMSPANGNKIAMEQYGNGIRLFEEKKQLAIKMFRNDFIGTLQGNNIATINTEREFNSAIFDTANNIGTYAGERGIILHGSKSGMTGGLRKLMVTGFQCYPFQSGQCTMVIVDYISGVEKRTEYPFNCIANTLNNITLPEPYIAENPHLLVLLDQSTIQFAQSEIKCQKNCDGEGANGCATAEGYDGTQKVRKKGFGLNVKYACRCNYEQLICDFSKVFTGELIWLKWQELVYEEQYKTNRFNGWVIYNREDIWSNIIPDLRVRYQSRFNEMIGASFIGMLKQYSDSCLNCRGVQIITNI